jgi:hypothetical protein
MGGAFAPAYWLSMTVYRPTSYGPPFSSAR